MVCQHPVQDAKWEQSAPPTNNVPQLWESALDNLSREYRSEVGTRSNEACGVDQPRNCKSTSKSGSLPVPGGPGHVAVYAPGHDFVGGPYHDGGNIRDSQPVWAGAGHSKEQMSLPEMGAEELELQALDNRVLDAQNGRADAEN